MQECRKCHYLIPTRQAVLSKGPGELEWPYDFTCNLNVCDFKETDHIKSLFCYENMPTDPEPVFV